MVAPTIRHACILLLRPLATICLAHYILAQLLVLIVFLVKFTGYGLVSLRHRGLLNQRATWLWLDKLGLVE